jgi:hypothetical protein
MATFPYFPTRYFPLQAAGGGSGDYPDAANVLETDTTDLVAGTYHEATVAEVKAGVTFGPASAYVGTYGQSAPGTDRDEMKNLIAAIVDRFTSVTNDLYTDVGGRLYKGQAPQGAELPYAVFMIVSDVPDRTFSESFDDVLIQFSLFADRSTDMVIETMFSHLKELFDECEFIVTDASLVWMKFQQANLMIEDHTTATGTAEVWHYAVDFAVYTTFER